MYNTRTHMCDLQELEHTLLVGQLDCARTNESGHECVVAALILVEIHQM